MLYAVSVNLASPFVRVNSVHHRELLPSLVEPRQRRKTFLAVALLKVPGPETQNTRSDRRAFPHTRRSAPVGESVYHDFSKFSRRNMMSIKGDKNFNTSICSGGASKPQNLTLGVELLSACQKMCQVSICFIRCTFLYVLARCVLNNPRLSLLVGFWYRRKKAFFTPPPFSNYFFNCSDFERESFLRLSWPLLEFLPSLGSCLQIFLELHVKPPVCFVISSFHPLQGTIADFSSKKDETATAQRNLITQQLWWFSLLSFFFSLPPSMSSQQKPKTCRGSVLGSWKVELDAQGFSFRCRNVGKERNTKPANTETLSGSGRGSLKAKWNKFKIKLLPKPHPN